MTAYFELFDKDGHVQLDEYSTFLRVFGSHTLTHNYSGTFTMAGFDSDDGFFLPAFKVNKTSLSPKAVLADNAGWGLSNMRSLAVPAELPDLSFVDATGVMTVTDNSVDPAFAVGAWSTDIILRFFYFKGGLVDIGASYGIHFPNLFEHQQISFEKTLYERERGTTINFFSSELGLQHLVGPDSGNFPRKGVAFEREDDIAQVGAAGIHTEIHNGITVKYPYLSSLEDLTFFRLTEPITFSASVYHEYPELANDGLCTIVSTSGDAAVDYKIASPEIPGYTPPETYAFQLFNASGETVFDSRFPTIQIIHAEVISQAQIADVLDNGATIDITLPVAESDPWVCCPYMTSFRTYNGPARTVRPKLTRINDTTLRIERNASPGSLFYKGLTQAMWVIVAR